MSNTVKPPSEDCTKEEAIEYLSNHIEKLNDQIAAMQHDDEKQTRAWALDRAVRVYEKSEAVVPWETIEEMAKNFYNYAMGEQK